MKSPTAAILVAVPSAAAWLSKSNAVSYHMPLHLRDEYLTLLSAGRGDTDEDRSRLEKMYTLARDAFFDMEDDSVLFLRAREEGARRVISDDFLTSSAGIQIGMWSDEGDVCRDREECEQCEIPEDFKLPLSSQPMDVMSFLGIQRAEPLRVDRRRTDDWT
mmetsp:Transcript_6106/g.13324  ORF Transcript_6106/g.13324 Transcript_6106/m.13324 type:complete len:161 (-) Transcript_6106:305-787(-)